MGQIWVFHQLCRTTLVCAPQRHVGNLLDAGADRTIATVGLSTGTFNGAGGSRSHQKGKRQRRERDDESGFLHCSASCQLAGSSSATGHFLANSMTIRVKIRNAAPQLHAI